MTCLRARLLHKWKNDVHKSISYPRTCGFAKGIDAHGTVTFTKQNKNHVRWICDVLKRMMSDGNVTFPKRSLVFIFARFDLRDCHEGNEDDRWGTGI